jgi:hypothetical protein
VKRSGFRNYEDVPLSLEERNREFSVSFPFGTQNPNYFQESEPYEVLTPTGSTLAASMKECHQGKSMDALWTCSPSTGSGVVCGHVGTISFSSPSYSVGESDRFLRLSVRRSGAGLESTSVCCCMMISMRDKLRRILASCGLSLQCR